MIKILNVFGIMNRGGAETGAMQALRRIDRTKFQYDFLVHKKGKGYFDSEILSYGSRILYLDGIKNPFKFYKNLKKIFEQYGPYHIIHSRLHHFSGFVLLYAKLLGIPIRIAHSHNDIPLAERTRNYIRRVYYFITKILIHKFSTAGLAVSERAAESLFGKYWNTNDKYQVMYTGIDLTPYTKKQDSTKIRNELKIPADGFIIGHVGSFSKQKNHPFIIDIFMKVLKLNANCYLIFCGDGKLKKEIEELSDRLHLNSNIRFLGLRDDVPKLMSHAMDLFILPSLYEGLPHVGIEAQAAGLTCFLSDTITKEVAIVQSLANFLPINQGSDIWVDSIIDFINKRQHLDIKKALDQIINSEFDINIGVQRLFNFYCKLYEDSIRTRP